jgi:diguanylate cyclase
LYVLIDPKGRDNIEHIASTLLEALSLPIGFEGLQIVVRPSIGISLFPEHGTSAFELISNADAAMYAAKTIDGSLGWAFYDGDQSGPASLS